jgi:hypothetical protein
VFRECLVEGFEEVLALGRESGATSTRGRPRKKRPARIPTPIA